MNQSRATRRFAVAVTLFIAFAAAALSYDHALIVARLVGTEPPLAYLVPLLPDGLIVLSSTALYEAAQAHAVRPGWATGGLVLGIGVTLVLNVASGWPHGWGGRLLNALPPLALIVAIEVLIGIFRRVRAEAQGAVTEPGPKPPVHLALARIREDYSQRQLADALGLNPTHVQRKWPRLEHAVLNGDGHE